MPNCIKKWLDGLRKIPEVGGEGLGYKQRWRVVAAHLDQAPINKIPAAREPLEECDTDVVWSAFQLLQPADIC